MQALSALDRLIHYQDPSLPPFSKIVCLFLAILLSSSLVAFDVNNMKREKANEAGTPHFASVCVSMSAIRCTKLVLI